MKNNNKNGYDVVLQLLWRIPVGLFMIAMGVFIAIFPLIWGDFESGLIYTLPLCVFAGAYLILQAVGIGFFFQKFRHHSVHNGNSSWSPVRTASYIKRVMWFAFIMIGIYVLIAIYFFVSIVNISNVYSILVGFGSLIAAFIFFLVAMKNKTDLKNKNYEIDWE